jgi:hypothetical protein
MVSKELKSPDKFGQLQPNFTYVRFISLRHESFRYTTLPIVGLSEVIYANGTYLLLSVSALFYRHECLMFPYQKQARFILAKKKERRYCFEINKARLPA